MLKILPRLVIAAACLAAFACGPASDAVESTEEAVIQTLHDTSYVVAVPTVTQYRDGQFVGSHTTAATFFTQTFTGTDGNTYMSISRTPGATDVWPVTCTVYAVKVRLNETATTLPWGGIGQPNVLNAHQAYADLFTGPQDVYVGVHSAPVTGGTVASWCSFYGSPNTGWTVDNNVGSYYMFFETTRGLGTYWVEWLGEDFPGQGTTTTFQITAPVSP